MIQQTTSLHYREGNSDKVYQVTVKPSGEGFVVDIEYGRRGSTLTHGTKTQTPVSEAAAKKIYEKLVKEKTGKGYQVVKDGIPYSHSENEGKVSGIQCQLLNPVDESELENLLHDPAWVAQEKHDGRRLLVRRNQQGVIEGINRRGLIVAIPKPIEEAFTNIAMPFVFDGEAVGDRYFIFDVLEFGTFGQQTNQQLSSMAYSGRLGVLPMVEKSLTGYAVQIVETAVSATDKTRLVAELKEDGKEGVVLKRLDAPYSAGRPASGGPALKFKFTDSVSAVVIAQNAKRSVQLGLLDESGNLVEAGNVTIPANHTIPAIHAIVEIRYLYAHPESGSLFQPIYLGERFDLTHEACVRTQLKYKRPAEIDDDEG